MRVFLDKQIDFGFHMMFCFILSFETAYICVLSELVSTSFLWNYGIKKLITDHIDILACVFCDTRSILRIAYCEFPRIRHRFHSLTGVCVCRFSRECLNYYGVFPFRITANQQGDGMSSRVVGRPLPAAAKKSCKWQRKDLETFTNLPN